MKRKILAATIQSVLGSAVVAASLPAMVTAQEKEELEEEVVITGSRIKRSNLDSSSPIELITAEDLIQEGRFSVADALRSSTANSFGSFVPASGSTAQSQATVDLLGVGPERTLVLIDGIRAPGSPSLGGTAININQIPMAIVENIDIMTSGASAVYGSDAIAGVVNVRLKSDYEGFSLSVNHQNPDDPGGEARDFSFVTGISSDKGNITFAYEHAEQKPIFDADRPYTAPSVSDTDGDGVFDTNVGVSTFGAAIVNPDTGLWEPSPLCEQWTADVPGFVGVVETAPASENRYCGFAYAGVSANQASTNRDSIFVNSSYELSENMDFFARALVTHNSSFGRYAPPAAAWPGDVPANSEHNPYNVDVPGRFRWWQIGNRDGSVDDYSQDYLAGLKGKLFDTFDYEVYYHHNNTDNKAVGEFYLSGAGVAYNLLNDIDFGSEQGVANLRSTILRQDINQFSQFYAGTSFEFGSLSGGKIVHYLGAESFEISYQTIVDAQSEAGLIGGSAGNSAALDRDIWAVFYETAIPISEQIEMQFAVRYDEYSDFGNETSPKLSLKYRPTDELMLRASWGQGFRAPTLQQLSQADSFAADFAVDWVSCQNLGVDLGDCTEQQYNTIRQANPNLDAETSTFINFGAVFDAESFNISVDYFDLKIEDAIRFVPIQDLVNAEVAGAPLPDPLLEIDRSNPELPEFRTSNINGPGLELQGFTLSTEYFVESDVGEFEFNLQTTYFIEWLEDNYAGGPLQDKAGWELQPQYRSQFTTTWRLGGHSIAWNMDYIPSTSGFESPDTENIESGLLLQEGSNDSFLIHNVTYTFNAGAWGDYRIGVRNLTDEDPILNSTGVYADGYDELYSMGHIGRLWSVGATWNL